MSGKIVPIGGAHKSARSLLAEVMNDEGMVKVVLVTLSQDGEAGFAQYGLTRAEMAWAAAVVHRHIFDDEPA